MRRRKVIEQGIERRMHRYQLALQVRRQLTDFDARLSTDGFQFVAIILTVGGARQVDVLRARRG
ncbi:hypothetical protein D3C80_1983180 [compost metagenome]